MREFLEREPNYINHIIELPKSKPISPLKLACVNGFLEEFDLLLSHGVKIPQDFLLKFITIIGYENLGRLESYKIITKKLIENGADVNYICYQDNGNVTVLHNCYTSIGSKMIRIFLEAGADVNISNKYYIDLYNPNNFNNIWRDADVLTHITQYMPEIDVFRALFEYGADPNRQNIYGCTAFMGIFVTNAVWYNYSNKIHEYFDIIQMFLDHGADLFLKDKNNMSALDYLCCYDRIPSKLRVVIVRFLNEKVGLKIH